MKFISGFFSGFFVIFCSCLCSAKVQIAFIRIPKATQGHVQLESHGQFAHVAISYQGQWLHTHPYWGVQLINSEALFGMGEIKIIQVNDHSEPTEHEVGSLLGKPYDHGYHWDGDKYYCSKLVGKLLNIQPTIMNFNTEVWSGKKDLPLGELGLSPDDIFFELKRKGASEISSCSKALL